MPIKMRVLYSVDKKKIVNIAKAIKAHYDLAVNSVDKVPPAYSCDKERLVILVLSGKNELDDKERRFCNELTKERASNVALMIDGNEALAENAKQILTAAGTNVLSDIKYIKVGLPFLGGVKPEEEADIYKWIDECLIPNMK